MEGLSESDNGKENINPIPYDKIDECDDEEIFDFNIYKDESEQ